MQVQFGYCSGASSQKIQNACSQALRNQSVTLSSTQYNALDTRLKAIEGAVGRIESKFNTIT